MKESSKSTPKVPNLRFPGFEDEWKERKLSDFLKFKNGINASKESYGAGYKFINVLDIIENDFINHQNIIGAVKISEEVFNKNIVEYGDILFQRSSETREDVGQSNVYLDKEMPATFGGFVIRGKRIKDYNPLFLNYLLKTSPSRKEITSKSGGSTRYNIGQETLSSVGIITTEIEEQAKIASFLSSIEGRIQTQSKIIDRLESLRLEFSQNIFSQELRFMKSNGSKFPNWTINKLGELCSKAKSGGTPRSTVKDYYDGNIPFLAISDMTSQGKYLKSTTKQISQKGVDNSNSWIVPKNSLIYSMYASVGFVSINKIELATSQAVMNLIINDKVELEFIYYYLKFFQRKIHRYVETGTQGNINASIVKQIPVKLPTTIEQKKIANFLSSIDKKLEKEKLILAQYQEQKKYLLQNLFI